MAWSLAAAAGLPVVVLGILYRWDVPLGDPDWISYPYSPFVLQRLARVPLAMLIGSVLALAVWLAGSKVKWSQSLGLTLAALGCAAMSFWSFMAPPQYRSQQFFSLHSPSQDGAFLLEAERVGSIRQYLRDFPDRALTPSEEMRGTRVVSNPPGTTLLVVATNRLLDRYPALMRWLDPTTEADGLSREQRKEVTETLTFAWLLNVLWLASAAVFYACARFFLPPNGATVVAICAVFTPMTLMYTPGKDPAQLITVAVPLWLWLSAYRQDRWWAALASGGTFVVSCMASLVHVWVAAIVFTGSAIHAHRDAGQGRRFWTSLLPWLLVGVAGAGTALYVLCDYDVLLASRSIVKSQTNVTRGVGSMPLWSQFLGIPIFMLLGGTAFWCGVLWLKGRRVVDGDAGFGLYLLVISAAVMVATFAFTTMDTPRLWIPFVPLLLLGLALQLRPFRAADRRARWLLAVLVLVHVSGSAVQWSLMDMRQAEMRLSTESPRMFY